MGQATQRKKLFDQALRHLKQFGREQLEPAQDDSPSASWLRNQFVATLMTAEAEGSASWQNRVYLAAQRHLDADVRRGIRTLMNDVLTCGLEPGRIVFGLVADAVLAQPELVGEFDSCSLVRDWVASQLKVPNHNVRVRYSHSIVPARGGIFGIRPTLELITTTKPVGELPRVVTNKSEREEQRRPRLTFLVSVYTSHGVDLDALRTSAPAPTFELTYWGPKDSKPVQQAQITPAFALPAFEALQMVGFWGFLERAEKHLAPMRAQAVALAAGDLPTILVSEQHANDSRFVNGTELFVRWRDVEMPAAAVYHGSFAPDFMWQLERLGAKVERAPEAQRT